MSDIDTIKKCPFCNGNADIYTKKDEKNVGFFVVVRCNVCGASAKPYYESGYFDKEVWKCSATIDAIEAWNLRTK